MAEKEYKIIAEKTKYHDYAFEFSFSPEILDYCRYLKQTLGWKEFGFFEKKWRFKDLNVVNLIKGRYPEVTLSDEVYEAYKVWCQLKATETARKSEAEEIKKKQDIEIDIPGLKMPLYPYQKVGLKFFLNNKGRAILADTMGLGKTAQALSYIVHQEAVPALVVCPSSVKFAWENEVSKWTKYSSFIMDSSQNLGAEHMGDLLTKHQIFIINYDILKKYFAILSAVKWQCIIGDEFHYIKNHTAIRTKNFKAIARNAPSLLLLSGTPLLSRPVELFNGLNLMDPQEWTNWYYYTMRYCQGHRTRFGWDARGASNIDELQNKISHYFLRRTKEEVLTELPPKIFTDIPVELSPESKFEYDLALDSFAEYLRQVKRDSTAEIRKKLQAEKLVRLAELRHITSVGKIKQAEDTIRDIIDSNGKLIVFSVYNEPLETLHAKFKDESVLLTGQTPDLMRKKMIEAFQNNPNVKIFFGGIRSAGVGITLTAASSVLFIDYSWVPADHNQAVDRAHRIGQKAESVNVYTLYAKGTIDEDMRDILAKKQLIFNKLMDDPRGAGAAQSSIVDDVLKKVMNVFETERGLST